MSACSAHCSVGLQQRGALAPPQRRNLASAALFAYPMERFSLLQALDVYPESYILYNSKVKLLHVLLRRLPPLLFVKAVLFHVHHVSVSSLLQKYSCLIIVGLRS